MERVRVCGRWWLLNAAAAVVAGAPLLAAWAPLPAGSRDELFEIPAGTWARRMAGDKVDILPSTITLTAGVRDILLLRNSDTVPQVFGPVLVMPGQDFRLPFETVSVNEFNCTAHSSGSMKVIVEPWPAPGIARLRWRMTRLSR
ncbi:hypothetical protein GJV26_25850 [Massilia dura]|uniref:Uncharacterized protein n=1 Tax=Pseudoduganella dura TaxID=321982 RepID=A0A6I3XJZ3_9BURK|nr:hypothetical protein [Pseudoduganella dura]MUI15856.1 hypothetical protein [Pseudoduganella dura]GGX89861.1 hypothetical protein GCM10007386_20930 [Pseudoduganella dura]